MKKKFVSFLLATIMLFSCTAPALATAVEPRDNRYKIVYEYSSPDYRQTLYRKFTVKDYDTMVAGRGVEAGMLTVVAAVIPGPGDDAIIVTRIAAIAAGLAAMRASISSALDATLFTMTVSQRYRYKYEVDRLDESNRHLLETRLYSKIVISYANGETDTTYHEINLK